MSVKVIDLKEAIEVVKKSQGTTPQIKTNFFSWLGTTGCQRNCVDIATLGRIFGRVQTNDSAKSRSDRKKLRSARKNHWDQFIEDQEWFTADQITESVAQGCASCKVLSQIFQHSFSGNQNGLSDKYEFSVTREFFLKRRALSQHNTEEIVQLFQPQGLNVQFQGFIKSNFLFDRELSIQRLQKWLDECLKNHQSCSNQSAIQDEGGRPARLLDLNPIQRNNELGIRLIETAPGASYQYACLSHRWDTAIANHQTNTANLSDFKQFINTERLPKNCHDAISIARDLKIPYLWIDSLCIIQDGDNGDDLQRELGKMGFIYQNAFLTIVAISSPDSSGGCFLKDNWPDLSFMVTNSQNEGRLIGARVLDRKGRSVSEEDFRSQYPLQSRGWVFQERLMSTRLLLCNYGEFAFECLKSSKCECESWMAPHSKHSDLNRNLTFTSERRFLLRDAMETHNYGEEDSGWKDGALRYWKAIVEAYMQLELRYTSDLLPAIAGCAQTLTPRLQLTYVAGMWKERLTSDLMWFVRPERRAPPRARPTDTTAPSWSWASVAMRQTVAYIDFKMDAHGLKGRTLLHDTIKDICCRPKVAVNPFSHLEEAYLKIDTVLYPWYLRSLCQQAADNSVGFTHRRWYHGLHTERQFHLPSCTTNPEGLPLGRAGVQVYLDGPLEDENIQAVDFDQCLSIRSRRCRLTQIFLMPALCKQGISTRIEGFMLLRRMPPTSNKPNCYRRIGLMLLVNKEAAEPIWDKMVGSRTKPQRGEFWLF